jgi:predicted SprT family Zn-dependent metalloprotease
VYNWLGMFILVYIQNQNPHKMYVHEVVHMAHSLMDKYGLISKGWIFRIDHAKTRCGCCFFDLGIISVSRYYIQSLDVRISDIRNTILHEIAHALAGCDAGHGPLWRLIAKRIGCDGERFNKVWKGAPKKYEISCDCGAIWCTRYRLHKMFKTQTCESCKTLHISKVH